MHICQVIFEDETLQQQARKVFDQRFPLETIRKSNLKEAAQSNIDGS